MTKLTKQQAHDKLADAIYWLSGFAASRGEDDSAGFQTSSMAEDLRKVQEFISDSEDVKPEPGQ